MNKQNTEEDEKESAENACHADDVPCGQQHPFGSFGDDFEGLDDIQVSELLKHREDAVRDPFAEVATHGKFDLRGKH
eukprot:11195816-Lingulodinium_polyedra.AAC.1